MIYILHISMSIYIKDSAHIQLIVSLFHDRNIIHFSCQRFPNYGLLYIQSIYIQINVNIPIYRMEHII